MEWSASLRQVPTRRSPARARDKKMGLRVTPGRLRSSAFVRRAPLLEISFEGRAVAAFEGETVAAALTAAGIRTLRTDDRGEPRGVFCGMGVCFDCLVRIDGRPNQRACMTKVAPGMRVEPERGVAAPSGGAAVLAPRSDSVVVDATDRVLVIGAGPGGLAAAESAAGAGAKVTVLDDRPEPGGQFYKQLAPSHGFAGPGAADRQYADGRALVERVRGAGVEILSGATVWCALAQPDGDGYEIGVVRDARALRFHARQVVIATGASENAHPVPGWTLPGVMTTGAAQTLVRAYRVAPGARVLLAGNGPLNLQVACELVRGGVEVVAVAEAAPRPGPSRAGAALRALVHAPDLVRDGLRYLRELVRHGVTPLFGHALIRIDGARAAERAILARIDRTGRPVPGSERAWEVDTVCLGYGFSPSNELTRLLGCRHDHRTRPFAGLAARRDENGAASRPGVLVAGDCGGIGGARVALAQGTLAGLEAARRLGHPGAGEARRRGIGARRALARGLAFQSALWRLFAAPPLHRLATADTVLCRCEGVTAGTIRGLAEAGGDDAGVLKRATRAGMGRCQGRYCGPAVARTCAEAAGVEAAAVGAAGAGAGAADAGAGPAGTGAETGRNRSRDGRTAVGTAGTAVGTAGTAVGTAGTAVGTAGAAVGTAGVGTAGTGVGTAGTAVGTAEAGVGTAGAGAAGASAGAVPDERHLFTPRFPVKPVPAVVLAREAPEWSEQDQGMAPPRTAAAPAPRSEERIDGEAEVAIVGAGILGSCAAWHLARNGVDVVVLERGRRNCAASGNNAGSLHVQLLAYDFLDRAGADGGPAARTLPLQRDSAAAWPELAAALGADLDIEITGGLMLAEDTDRLERLRRKAALERRHGVEVEVLSASELRDLAPYVSPRMAGAAWCAAEGRINPLRAGPAVLEGAVAAGARVHEEAEVLEVTRAGAGFEVRTARGAIRAGKVLNACGAWSARIAEMAGGRLPARAHPIQLIVTEAAPPFVGHLLAFADRHLTLKQVRNGNLVIGGGWRATLDADTGRPTVLRESFEGNLWVASRVLPGLDAMHVIRSWAAMNVAVDGAPILGELPGVPGFFHAVTVNGMTLGPLLGRITAEWMRTGRPPPGVGYFTLKRFG